MNSDFKVKTETHAATQTDEFEYLFKETVVQPFTEEYFVNIENRVRFYTGLPGFVRIHVERVIGLLRQKYTILQSTLPLDYLTCSNCPLIDRMVRVCSALKTFAHLLSPVRKLFNSALCKHICCLN